VARRSVLAILTVAILGSPRARRDGQGLRALVVSGDVTDGLGRSAEGVVEGSVVGDAATGSSKVATMATRTMETVLIVILTCLPGIARDREFQELVFVAWRNMADVDFLATRITRVSFVAFVGDLGCQSSGGGSTTEFETLGAIVGGDTASGGVVEDIVTTMTTWAMAMISRVVVSRVFLVITVVEVGVLDVDSSLNLPGIKTDGDGMGIQWVAWGHVANGDLLAIDWWRARGREASTGSWIPMVVQASPASPPALF